MAKKRRKDGLETKKKLTETALRLFRENGYDNTTMRQIAEESEMSLGAAYHYFRSKESVVQEYYERHQDEVEAFAKTEIPENFSFDDRVSLLFHAKMRMLHRDAALISAISKHIAVPGDPLSAFGPETRELRTRSIKMFAELAGDQPAAFKTLLPVSLWALQMGIVLYFIHDESDDRQKTHELIDAACKLLPTFLKLGGLPLGRSFVDGIQSTLESLGLLSTDSDD